MEYLTENELAKRLQISRTTLYQLRKEGLPYRRIHRTIRYLPEEVETWLAQHGQGTADTTSRKIEKDI